MRFGSGLPIGSRYDGLIRPGQYIVTALNGRSGYAICVACSKYAERKHTAEADSQRPGCKKISALDTSEDTLQGKEVEVVRVWQGREKYTNAFLHFLSPGKFCSECILCIFALFCIFA